MCTLHCCKDRDLTLELGIGSITLGMNKIDFKTKNLGERSSPTSPFSKYSNSVCSYSALPNFVSSNNSADQNSPVPHTSVAEATNGLLETNRNSNRNAVKYFKTNKIKNQQPINKHFPNQKLTQSLNPAPKVRIETLAHANALNSSRAL
jgi:hypothetical protein